MTVPFFGVSLMTFCVLLLIGMVIAIKWPNNIVTSNVEKVVG